MNNYVINPCITNKYDILINDRWTPMGIITIISISITSIIIIISIAIIIVIIIIII